MSQRIVHMVSESTPEDAVRQLSLLLGRLGPERHQQAVLVCGAPPGMLSIPDDCPVRQVPRRLAWPTTWAPRFQRMLDRAAPDVVMTWGHAATLAAAGRCARPILAVMADPAEVDSFARWWRSAFGEIGQIHILCGTGTVQRRLIEAGIPPDVTAVVRPGVDFGQTRQVDRAAVRRRLGIDQGARVLLTPSPPSRQGGHYFAIWASAILRRLWPEVRLLLPGISREQRRLQRFADHIYCREIYHFTGDRYTPAELLASSDLLVVPALEDVPTGWLMEAMAMSVPIVASAVPAVTEFVADGHNAFLCKPREPHTLAMRIRDAFDAPQTCRRQAEAARAEAFDAFRLQRALDRYVAAMENARTGRWPRSEAAG